MFRGEVDRFRARQVAGDRAKVQGQMADVRQKVSGGALGPCRTFGCRDGNRGSFFSLWIFTKDHIHANYLFLNKGYEGVLNLELLKKCAFGAIFRQRANFSKNPPTKVPPEVGLRL